MNKETIKKDDSYESFLAQHKADEQRNAAKRLLTGKNGRLYLAVLRELPDVLTEQSKLLPLILRIVKQIYKKAGDLEWCKADACHILGHLTETGYVTSITNTLMNGSYATGSQHFYQRNKSVSEIDIAVERL